MGSPRLRSSDATPRPRAPARHRATAPCPAPGGARARGVPRHEREDRHRRLPVRHEPVPTASTRARSTTATRGRWRSRSASCRASGSRRTSTKLLGQLPAISTNASIGRGMYVADPNGMGARRASSRAPVASRPGSCPTVAFLPCRRRSLQMVNGDGTGARWRSCSASSCRCPPGGSPSRRTAAPLGLTPTAGRKTTTDQIRKLDLVTGALEVIHQRPRKLGDFPTAFVLDVSPDGTQLPLSIEDDCGHQRRRPDRTRGALRAPRDRRHAAPAAAQAGSRRAGSSRRTARWSSTPARTSATTRARTPARSRSTRSTSTAPATAGS